MSESTATPAETLDRLAQGVEAWTAQSVPLALTGGYDRTMNQPIESAWQKNPIRSLADFYRHVEEARFEVRGIAAIHGVDFGTFALDMDKEMGRADFAWLTENGYVGDDDLIFKSPGGVHVVYRHDPRLLLGKVKPSEEHPGCIVLDGFDGPRGDGTLHVTLRGRKGANVTKVLPTVRPVTGEPYTATHGWSWDPLPLPEWFRLPLRPTRKGVVRRRTFGSNGARRGAEKILDARCAEIARLGIDSGRNNLLNESAYDLFVNMVLREGSLTVKEVAEALTDAASRSGLDDDEIDGVFRSAWDAALLEHQGVAS